MPPTKERQYRLLAGVSQLAKEVIGYMLFVKKMIKSLFC
jgi:hypothetical protein